MTHFPVATHDIKADKRKLRLPLEQKSTVWIGDETQLIRAGRTESIGLRSSYPSCKEVCDTRTISFQTGIRTRVRLGKIKLDAVPVKQWFLQDSLGDFLE